MAKLNFKVAVGSDNEIDVLNDSSKEISKPTPAE